MNQKSNYATDPYPVLYEILTGMTLHIYISTYPTCAYRKDATDCRPYAPIAI